jgi:pantothenate synthetase
LHTYIDPKDNLEKASHLLKDYRQFVDIQKLCEELRSNSEAIAHPIKEVTSAYAQSQQQQYVPSEDIYVPTEIYPVSQGHVNMIHKASVSKRESKKFSREIKLAEVAMAIVPEYIDWSDQSILFSRADHLTAVPRPGHISLVLEA